MLLAGLALVARAAAFAREIVFGGLFGANAATDAFYLAFAVLALVPMMLINAVPQVFISRYEAARSEGPEARQRLLGGSVLMFSTVLGAVAALVFWKAEIVVALLAPEFQPETREIAVDCVRAFAPVLPLMGISSVFVALARANGSYGLSQAAPTLISLGAIAGQILWWRTYGVVSGAIGLTLGVLAQAGLVAAYPFVAGLRLRLDAGAWRTGLRVVAASTALIVINHGGGYLPILVDRYYAAKLPEGALSCMGYALRLISLPHMLVFQSLVVVLLTTISRAAHRGAPQEAEALLSRGLRLTSVALFPILIVAAALAEPLVRLVFGRGAFDEEAVHLTALLLACYVPSMCAETVRGTLVTGFFGMGQVRISLGLGAVRVVAMLAVFPWVWRPLGAAGLVLAVGAIDALTVPVALIWARGRLGMGFPWLLAYTTRLVGASLLGAAAAWWVFRLLDLSGPQSPFVLIFALGAAGGVGLALAYATARILGIEEVEEGVERLRGFIRRGR